MERRFNFTKANLKNVPTPVDGRKAYYYDTDPTLFTPPRSSGLKRPERAMLGAPSRTARSNTLSASWFGPLSA